MSRLSWLAAFRRHFVAASFRHRGLHCCGAVNGRVKVDFATPFLQTQWFHASRLNCSAERNYYEILGVPRDATGNDIKKAFHALAKKYHPNANKNNPSAKRKFQEIREAYETLQDSEKRENYDRMGTYGSENTEFGAGNAGGFSRSYESHNFGFGAGDAGGFGHSYQTHNFSGSFRKIFSEIFEHEHDRFSSDIQMELSLTFSEAANGCKKNISFKSYGPCITCQGLGYPLNAKRQVCRTCRGVGRVTIPPFTSTCSTCRGSGQVVKEHCGSCKGSGAMEGLMKVDVTIPAGVNSGDTIRVPGAGNSGGQGSEPGSLLLKLKVAKDSVFARDGADVYVDCNISFTQAILGGNVDVPTLSGKAQVKIPKGVQPGQLLLLRGKGLAKQGFLINRGDQYVRFRINLPTQLNERQRAILEELAREEINNTDSGSGQESWLQQLCTG